MKTGNVTNSLNFPSIIIKIFSNNYRQAYKTNFQLYFYHNQCAVANFRLIILNLGMTFPTVLCFKRKGMFSLHLSYTNKK